LLAYAQGCNESHQAQQLLASSVCVVAALALLTRVVLQQQAGQGATIVRTCPHTLHNAQPMHSNTTCCCGVLLTATGSSNYAKELHA
jgi:hypothetical protein